jgi:hypothetical protein
MWNSNQNEEDFHYQTGYDESGALSLYFIPSYTMSPGKPYIIKWTKPDGYVAYNGENAATCSDIVSPTFESVTISKTLSSVTSEDDAVSFCGTYDYQSWDAENPSILFLGTENQLHWPDAGASLGACRAYFQLTEGTNGVREFKLSFGDGTQTIIGHTGITEKADAWYTVNGVKLSGMPRTRGIYVKNGKKIVVK